MTNKTPEQTDIEWIKQELRDIKASIQDLNAFKWKVIGVSGFVVLIVEVLFHGK